MCDADFQTLFCYHDQSYLAFSIVVRSSLPAIQLENNASSPNANSPNLLPTGPNGMWSISSADIIATSVGTTKLLPSVIVRSCWSSSAMPTGSRRREEGVERLVFLIVQADIPAS